MIFRIYLYNFTQFFSVFQVEMKFIEEKSIKKRKTKSKEICNIRIFTNVSRISARYGNGKKHAFSANE